MGDTSIPTDTLFIGNLDQRVTTRIIYDLCIQAGPVQRVNLPEAYTGVHKGYAFCHYETVESAKYAHALFKDLLQLFGRPVSIAYSPGGRTDS
ncbi:g4298 [Coccomyxa viridis]|uniref:G4298 protein n=1 Tax=Coccomyxa viridis TaxID=1274662 RepID=A0ABP1FPY6_9CHLO